MFDNIFNPDSKFNLVSERNKIQLPLLTTNDAANKKETSISGEPSHRNYGEPTLDKTNEKKPESEKKVTNKSD